MNLLACATLKSTVESYRAMLRGPASACGC